VSKSWQSSKPQPGLCRAIQTKSKWEEFKEGKWPKVLSLDAAINHDITEENYKERWKVVPPANLVQVSAGGIYCFSMWTIPMTTSLGVVAPAAADWSVASVLPAFSAAAIGMGVTAMTLGGWIEKSGPRLAGVVGAACWGTGLATCGLAVETHSLPLLYAGYSALGGVAWGMLYLSPVDSIMKWFPDRRGLATGITLSAFGVGATVSPAIIQSLLDFYAVAPEFVGPTAQVALETLADGTQVIAADSGLDGGLVGREVVVATAAQAANSGLDEGVYLVGTGSTGAGPAFATLGALYGTTAAVASRYCQLPPEGWKPKGFVADESSTAGLHMGLTKSQALSTPSSKLLWLSVFGQATGGLALISSSKIMMADIWATQLPDLVTPAFATTYVTVVGAATAGGRLGWAIASDTLGRKPTYLLFATAIPIMGGAPFLTHYAVESSIGAEVPLAAFYGGSVLAMSYYGGLFSVLPAYIADLYGQKHSGAIHGAIMTAWSASAVVGPMGLGVLRSHSEKRAIDSLLGQVSPADFEKSFGAQIEQASVLVDAKTVTIARLMEIAPPGVVDPTPFLYDTTCFAAAGLLGVAAVANVSITAPDVPAILAAAKEKEQASTSGEVGEEAQMGASKGPEESK